MLWRGRLNPARQTARRRNTKKNNGESVPSRERVRKGSGARVGEPKRVSLHIMFSLFWFQAARLSKFKLRAGSGAAEAARRALITISTPAVLKRNVAARDRLFVFAANSIFQLLGSLLPFKRITQRQKLLIASHKVAKAAAASSIAVLFCIPPKKNVLAEKLLHIFFK